MSPDRFPLNRPTASRLEGCCEINRQLMKAVSPTHLGCAGSAWRCRSMTVGPDASRSARLGRILVITRNGSAVLGETRGYPELRFSHDCIHARSPEDTFDIDLPRFTPRAW